MASRQPDRYIPHVCDVFRLPANNSGLKDNGHGGMPSDRLGNTMKYANYEDHSDEDHYDYDGRRLHQKGRNCANSGSNEIPINGRATRNNYHQTLTEKDIQHIERHLSMKKTIRKQLSRHLSQAFVEHENESNTVGRQNGERDDRPDKKSSSSVPAYGLTFSRSKVAKSENFFDLLKEVGEDGEDDSGHCSPTREMESNVIRQEQRNKDNVKQNYSKSGGRSTTNVGLSENSATGDQLTDPKKSGFWKKMTVRGKSKR